MAAELIRLLESDNRSISISTREDDEFEEGDKVEALYKGKGTKWFSGVVKRVNRDGTYEIRYDDGDNEVDYYFNSISLFDLYQMKVHFYIYSSFF